MRRFWTNSVLWSPKFWRQSSGESTASAWIKCRSTWPITVKVAATVGSDQAPVPRSSALRSPSITIEATLAALLSKRRLNNRLARLETPWSSSFSLPSSPTLVRPICSIALRRAQQTTTTKRSSCRQISLLSRNSVGTRLTLQQVSQHWL